MAWIYSNWERVAIEISEGKILDWKKNPHVTYMLEHESHDAARAYIKYLRGHGISDNEIQRLSDLNDMYGSATRGDFLGINTSPSSIRYIRHAYDACQEILKMNLSEVTIIEVGGGYGGLALITFEMAKLLGVKLEKYIIYDLPGVQELQKYYLGLHGVASNVEWHSCELYGGDLASETNKNYYLVSHYCMGEIPGPQRAEYLKNLFPIIRGAFFAWNNGSVADFDAWKGEKNICLEEPDTSGGHVPGGNKVVRLFTV